jgi:hypothetical protein
MKTTATSTAASASTAAATSTASAASTAAATAWVGAECTASCSLLDVVPTVLAMAGVDLAQWPQLRGQNLAALALPLQNLAALAPPRLDVGERVGERVGGSPSRVGVTGGDDLGGGRPTLFQWGMAGLTLQSILTNRYKVSGLSSVRVGYSSRWPLKCKKWSLKCSKYRHP